MSVEVVAVALDATSRRHLARALEERRHWCRANGAPFPAGLAQLELLAASNGQERPKQTGADLVAEAAPVAIAFTYEEAGAVLSVSARTIRRLVEEGRLRAITVGGPRTPRIHRSDLEAYAESLRHPQEVSS
ncbi:MAG TPA: helix-turn-helix domain-containing protein [Acidimicrobiales bacterium]|nr:helix-turn-helix domain-containing protein [Acidimicrobiales bacterium]